MKKLFKRLLFISVFPLVLSGCSDKPKLVEPKFANKGTEVSLKEFKEKYANLCEVAKAKLFVDIARYGYNSQFKENTYIKENRSYYNQYSKDSGPIYEYEFYDDYLQVDPSTDNLIYKGSERAYIEGDVEYGNYPIKFYTAITYRDNNKILAETKHHYYAEDLDNSSVLVDCINETYSKYQYPTVTSVRSRFSSFIFYRLFGSLTFEGYDGHFYINGSTITAISKGNSMNSYYYSESKIQFSVSDKVSFKMSGTSKRDDKVVFIEYEDLEIGKASKPIERVDYKGFKLK